MSSSANRGNGKVRGHAGGSSTLPPAPERPPQAEDADAQPPEPVLLDDIVEEPALHPDALDSLISDDDPRAVLRALARARLPELKQRRSTIFGQFFRCYFGGGRLSAADQLRALLSELTSANVDAARFIESCSTVEKARLRSQSSSLEVAAEREELRAQIARHQNSARRAAQPSPATSSLFDALRRADLEKVIPLIAKSNAEAIEESLGRVQTALETQLRAVDAKVTDAGQHLAGVFRRVSALEGWTHTAAESQAIIVARIEERAAETAALADQLDALEQPAALRSREREHELAEADHQIELARKRAEITAHQAAARRHRERPRSPTEEFAQRAREQLRTATSKRRTLDRIRSEIDARLRQTAERHGEDSEAYKTERDAYDDALVEMEDLK